MKQKQNNKTNDDQYNKHLHIFSKVSDFVIICRFSAIFTRATTFVAF